MSDPLLIHVSASHHVAVGDAFVEEARPRIERALARFADRLTRLEVHFDDENADKGGANDKRCTLEARLKGLDAEVVRHNAPSLELALSGALDRMVRVLDRVVGKHRHVKGLDPYDVARP